MRARSPKFIVTSIAYAALASFILWLIFGAYAHPTFFLIPFCWIMHIRSMNSQVAELHDRLVATMDLLVAVLEKDPDFDLRDYFENNGIDDDDDYE